MPNLINIDNTGDNVFYNYITPVINGESTASTTWNATTLNNFFDSATQSIGGTFNNTSSQFTLRLPGQGLEMKTGAVTGIADGDGRFYFAATGSNTLSMQMNSNNANSSTWNNITVGSGSFVFPNPYALFMIWSKYAFIQSIFDSSRQVCHLFRYAGFLREPAYDTQSISPQGFTIIAADVDNSIVFAQRPTASNSTSAVDLSTAANAITSPPIVCTPGTTPGVGEATFTDVVIRDADAPNNPVGKLWNCIDMPATCNVGELWRNTGAYDADASTSDQDVYLCVMPWGTRKLGMRVWTENI